MEIMHNAVGYGVSIAKRKTDAQASLVRMEDGYEDWRMGYLIRTRETERWSDADAQAAHSTERMMLFTNFTPEDEGRSRQLVAKFEKAEDCLRASRENRAWPRVLKMMKDELADPSYLSLSRIEHIIAALDGTG